MATSGSPDRWVCRSRRVSTRGGGGCSPRLPQVSCSSARAYQVPPHKVGLRLEVEYSVEYCSVEYCSGDPSASELRTRFETEEDCGSNKLGNRYFEAQNRRRCRVPWQQYFTRLVVPFPTAARLHLLPPTVVVARDISVPYLGRTSFHAGAVRDCDRHASSKMKFSNPYPLPSAGAKHAGPCELAIF